MLFERERFALPESVGKIHSNFLTFHFSVLKINENQIEQKIQHIFW